AAEHAAHRHRKRETFIGERTRDVAQIDGLAVGAHRNESAVIDADRCRIRRLAAPANAHVAVIASLIERRRAQPRVPMNLLLRLIQQVAGLLDVRALAREAPERSLRLVALPEEYPLDHDIDAIPRRLEHHADGYRDRNGQSDA